MAFSQGMVDNFKEAFALFDKQGHGTFVLFGLPRALNGLHSLPCPQLRTCTKARDFVDLGLHLAQDFPTFLSRCLPACHFSEVCYRVQCVLLPPSTATVGLLSPPCSRIRCCHHSGSRPRHERVWPGAVPGRVAQHDHRGRWLRCVAALAQVASLASWAYDCGWDDVVGLTSRGCMLLLGVRLLSFFQGCIVVAMGVAGMVLISFDGGDTAVCFCHLVVLHHCCYFFRVPTIVHCVGLPRRVPQTRFGSCRAPAAALRPLTSSSVYDP